jgi:hypothetical protein
LGYLLILQFDAESLLELHNKLNAIKSHSSLSTLL